MVKGPQGIERRPWDKQGKIRVTGVVPMAATAEPDRGALIPMILPKDTILLLQKRPDNPMKPVMLSPWRTRLDTQILIRDGYLIEIDWEDVP
jgi:hypothetical protein